jgi:predicted dehydrogenase
MSNRRSFIKKVTAGAAAISVGGVASGMPAYSYSRIIGANDRLRLAIAGLGRRLGAFIEPIALESSNVELLYLCDVMKSQREKAAATFSKRINYQPKLENDIRKVFDDKSVDALINATPDHWHAPGTWMALKAGQHVFVEKPCGHNLREDELLIAFQKKYNKVVQMGNQQRSAPESIEIIGEIHNGVIGEVYKAVAFYSNSRGSVPIPQLAPVPEGLDWDLFQGPAPRKPYMHDTWNYNWHWYGWDYGTAESGNNATHELDIARWALQATYPERVEVEAAKRHFVDDGWTMYDTMDATFYFPGEKVIKWDGKSRNAHKTYGSDRGTIIYGTDGTVYVDRGGYRLYDRAGRLVRERRSGGQEAGTALGGGGDMSTLHVVNFFDAIRGKAEPKAPIHDAALSNHLINYVNVAYRIGKPFDVCTETGRIFDRDAMKIWGRDYEPGWVPVL